MNRKKLFTILNIISYAFVIMVSFMVNGAEAFTIPGIKPLITPAPYAFYIWILIYVLLGIWVIRYGLRIEDEELYCRVSRFFSWSMLCTGLSLLIQQPWTLFLILGALLGAIGMYLSIDRRVKQSSFFSVPISIFTAWLMIAFSLELTIVLTSLGYGQLFGLSELFWALFSIVLLGLISIYVAQIYQDYIFPLVFIWAEIAIAIEHLQVTPLLLTICGVIIMTGLALDKCVLNHNKK